MSSFQRILRVQYSLLCLAASPAGLDVDTVFLKDCRPLMLTTSTIFLRDANMVETYGTGARAASVPARSIAALACVHIFVKAESPVAMSPSLRRCVETTADVEPEPYDMRYTMREQEWD